jgi:hypothetical protein
LRPETITALAAVITAAALFVTAWRGTRKVNTKLDEIHVLVNSRLDEALAKIAAFETRLGLEPGEDPDTPIPNLGGQ